MTELDACTYVADLLKSVGFEHRWSSMKSEACYYALPGHPEVVRVAAHRYGGPEFGVAPVVVCVTLTHSLKWHEPRLHDMTAKAIGMYHLRIAGLIALTAKERSRRAHAQRMEVCCTGEKGWCAMTERETAMANLDEALQRGLIDVKLLVPNAKSLSEEEIFAGVNRIDAALKAGKCDTHDQWPHDIEPKPFGPLMD